MANIEKVKPGDVLYDVHSERMGNTTMRRLGWWRVYIVSVAEDGRSVMARWNGNPEKKYYRQDVARWRLSIPKKLAAEQGLDTVKP
jgi:hypothetical protein